MITTKGRTYNMGFAKMGAYGSRVSTFCFSIWLHIQQDVINLALVLIINFFIFIQRQLAGADGILFPALRQYLTVSCNAHVQLSVLLRQSTAANND